MGAGYRATGSAAPPRGDGRWCQRIEGSQVTIHRAGGNRWAEIVDPGDMGPMQQGRTTVYDEDGETVARVVERRDYETVHFEEAVPGVAAPRVCRRGEHTELAFSECGSHRSGSRVWRRQ